MECATWVAILIGVLSAWFVDLLCRENPAGIPIGRVLFRALPGIALFIALNTSIARLAAFLIPSWSWFLGGDPVFRLLAAGLVGFLVPHANRLKNSLLTREFTRKYRIVAGCLQWIDESSSGYYGKIIDREERKLSFEVFRENGEAQAQCAIHRLFEFHLIEIARNEARHRERDGQRPQAALQLFDVRNVHVKLRFFTRFLGFRHAAAHIRIVAKDPLTICSSWPPSPEDRRVNRTAGYDRARRKYEQPYVENYVLGKF